MKGLNMGKPPMVMDTPMNTMANDEDSDTEPM